MPRRPPPSTLQLSPANLPVPKLTIPKYQLPRLPETCQVHLSDFRASKGRDLVKAIQLPGLDGVTRTVSKRLQRYSGFSSLSGYETMDDNNSESERSLDSPIDF